MFIVNGRQFSFVQRFIKLRSSGKLIRERAIANLDRALRELIYFFFIFKQTRPTTHHPRPTTHDPRPTTHDPRPTTHDPRPTTHDPRLTTHDPRPTTHDPPPTTHHPRPTKHPPTTHPPTRFSLTPKYITFQLADAEASDRFNSLAKTKFSLARYCTVIASSQVNASLCS